MQGLALISDSLVLRSAYMFVTVSIVCDLGSHPAGGGSVPEDITCGHGG